MASHAIPAEDPWQRIHAPDIALHLEPASSPEAAWVQALLAEVPFGWRAEGTPGCIEAIWQALPADLLADIVGKAGRFAVLMGVERVGVRLEGINGNACTKVHADYTDVRLIQTYAGPGTDYATIGDPEGPLERVPTGWLGLFKGRTYPSRAGRHHAPCLHRSPPIAGTGERRLVLVIDTLVPG